MLGSFQIWLRIHLLCDLRDFSQAVTSSRAEQRQAVGSVSDMSHLFWLAGDFGMFREEGSDLQQGHAHFSPLEGRQQKMRPNVPEPRRCPCL